MRKTASILAIAGSITLLGAGAAQANTLNDARYGGADSATVSDGTIAPGEAVIFSVTGGVFDPNEAIRFTVDRTNATPSAAGFGAGGAASARGGLIVLNQIILDEVKYADGNGNFSTTVTLTEEGVYTLTAAAVDGSPAPISQTVVVDSDYATSTGTTGGTTGTSGGTTGTTGGTTTATKGGLANTGIDSAMGLWGAAGIGALGLGAGSIVVARRRSAEA